MNLPANLQEGAFVSRPNRFLCLVQLSRRKALVRAHLPDPGRLRELLQPGARLWLEPKPGAHRKTAYQVWLVEKNETLVSLNTGLPNLLVQEALAQGRLKEFSHYTSWQRERRAGDSRLDFCLQNRDETCWLEVKSVTLVKDGRGLFPDAPTARGRKHIGELERLRQNGARAVALFVVQRADAYCVSANAETDPQFAEALRAAHRKGVEIAAYTCNITPTRAVLSRPIPVDVA